MAKQLRKLDVCANCGRSIYGENFCPNCGQENTEQIVSARHLLKDISDEFLKFDSKLLITIGALLFKPGFLTREYIAGRRVRYIAPWRLFFTVCAFYFLCYSLSGFGQYYQQMISNQQMDAVKSVESAPSRREVGKPLTPERVRRQQRFKSSLQRGFALQSWMVANMSLQFYFFVPLTALGMQWLYFRHRRYYIEHMVFAAHLSAFTSLTFIPFIYLRKYGAVNLVALAFSLTLALNLIYTFAGLRVVYQESFFKTLIKTVLMWLIPTLCYSLLVMLAVGTVMVFGMLHG